MAYSVFAMVTVGSKIAVEFGIRVERGQAMFPGGLFLVREPAVVEDEQARHDAPGFEAFQTFPYFSWLTCE